MKKLLIIAIILLIGVASASQFTEQSVYYEEQAFHTGWWEQSIKYSNLATLYELRETNRLLAEQNELLREQLELIRNVTGRTIMGNYKVMVSI